MKIEDVLKKLGDAGFHITIEEFHLTRDGKTCSVPNNVKWTEEMVEEIAQHD